MKKMSKKIISLLLLTVMLLGCVTACGTEKLEGPSSDKTVSVDKKQDTTDISEDEIFDVDSTEDTEVDYSKYDEKKGNKAKGEKSENATNQDKYMTDPVPEGRPNPVEPEDAEIDTSTQGTCYMQISCATILNCMSDLTPGKEGLVPSDGIILGERAVTFYPGESVFDVLQRETQNNRIHMEASFTPKYNSAYVEGINNLYEFDCGTYSGWMYCVNGWYPNYGCSRYVIQEGDVIHWNYTCDLGRDLGQTWVK